MIKYIRIRYMGRERTVELFLMVAVVCIVMYVVFHLYTHVFIPFENERRFIKMEIKRANNEKEKVYWRKKLRRLYISLIPFMALFIKNEEE